MKPIKIKCGTCGGSGVADLPDQLAETLAAVKSRREACASDVLIAVRDRVGVTAINNRLEDLRALGLVTRHRDGKQWIYSVTA